MATAKKTEPPADPASPAEDEQEQGAAGGAAAESPTPGTSEAGSPPAASPSEDEEVIDLAEMIRTEAPRILAQERPAAQADEGAIERIVNRILGERQTLERVSKLEDAVKPSPRPERKGFARAIWGP